VLASDPRPKGGKTIAALSIHEERTVKVTALPEGSCFKGYANFVVQGPGDPVRMW